MQSVWFKDHKDKEERRKQILSHRNAFDDLREVLEQNFKKKEAVRDYSPGWAEKQIAVNEYNAAISEILNLIDVDKELK